MTFGLVPRVNMLVSEPRLWQSVSGTAGERKHEMLCKRYLTSISFPLRPILKKDLLVRSSETGTKQDIEEALQLAADGIVSSRIEILDLFDLNMALDRLKAGVLGKLVLDLRHPGKVKSSRARNSRPAISGALPSPDQEFLRRYGPSL